MPTTKPRVWVTLEPEAYEVLVGMARLGNSSPGRVLAEIAKPVLPALKRLVEAAGEFAAWEKSLKSHLGEVHSGVTEGIDAAITALEARMVPSGGVPGGLDDVFSREGSMVSPGPSAETGSGCASIPRSAKPGPISAPSPPAPSTPPSNTGVILTRHKRNQRVSRGSVRRGI